MEMLRDVAAEHGIAMADLNRFVTVHEIGHQFELTHNYIPLRDVMTTRRSNAEEALIPTWPISFSDDDLKEIRNDIPLAAEWPGKVRYHAPYPVPIASAATTAARNKIRLPIAKLRSSKSNRELCKTCGVAPGGVQPRRSIAPGTCCK